jgi:hypothetical protein
MGSLQIAVALFLYLLPGRSATGLGTLTPLTVRSTSGWFALGVLGFLLARDGRWSSARVLVESLLVSLAILAIGIARAWQEFDTGRVGTWLFVAGIAAAVAFLVPLYVTISRRRAVGLAA